MLSQATVWHSILRKSLLGPLVGTVIWILLLLRGAAMANSQTLVAAYSVSFGPLELHTLSKQLTSGGTVASISIEPDITWYILLWCIVGGLYGLAKARVKRRVVQEI